MEIDLFENILEIIQEEQDELEHLETGISRELVLEQVPGKVGVVTGIRRCGKSFRMDQIKKELIQKGIPKHRIVSVRLADERWHPMPDRLLTQIEDTYLRAWPLTGKHDRVYWFFDEIQLAPHWSFFVERLNRNRHYEIWLTGSSSHALSRDIATELRGRTLSYELFPFSFREYALAFGTAPQLPETPTLRRKIQSLCQDYFQRGGFPEVTHVSVLIARKILTEYYRTLLSRDLIERYALTQPQTIELVLKTWTHQAATLSTINKTQKQLKALGLPISVSHLSQYQNWVMDSYYLYRVPIYTDSLQKERVNPVKLYVVDLGFLRLLTTRFNGKEGRILENWIFMELRRFHEDIRYYKTTKGLEVDFVLPTATPRLIQVCYDMSDPQTREREILALQQAMDELSLMEGWIITWNEEKTIPLPGNPSRLIHILPTWKFLLTLNL
ncbi:ATP-binding protein [Bdellovibrionota bacterium FG-1]